MSGRYWVFTPDALEQALVEWAAEMSPEQAGLRAEQVLRFLYSESALRYGLRVETGDVSAAARFDAILLAAVRAAEHSAAYQASIEDGSGGSP